MAATGSAFRIIGSRWRDSLLRHLATTPGAMRCRLDRPGHATTTWSAPFARQRYAHATANWWWLPRLFIRRMHPSMWVC